MPTWCRSLPKKTRSPGCSRHDLVAVVLHRLGRSLLRTERGSGLGLGEGLVVLRGGDGGERLRLAVGDSLQGGQLLEELLRVRGVDRQGAVERVAGVGGDG